MTVALADRRTALYRFFDRTGSPLYFGITHNTKVRFAHHRRHKDWWRQVDHDRTVIVWYDNRTDAEVAELAAIRDERPRHNIVTGDENGCATFLPPPDGRPRGRYTWTPADATPAQRRAIRAIHRILERKARIEEERLAAIDLCTAAGVPRNRIAKEIGMGRATLYRHVPVKKSASESDDQ